MQTHHSASGRGSFAHTSLGASTLAAPLVKVESASQKKEDEWGTHTEPFARYSEPTGCCLQYAARTPVVPAPDAPQNVAAHRRARKQHHAI